MEALDPCEIKRLASAGGLAAKKKLQIMYPLREGKNQKGLPASGDAGTLGRQRFCFREASKGHEHRRVGGSREAADGN